VSSIALQAVARPLREAPLVDELLAPFTGALGADFTAYRNHVCRVVGLCELLAPLSDTDRRQLQIAGAFHDLGMWTPRTLDYLEPSAALAAAHLADIGRAPWSAQVTRIVREHHRLFGSGDRLAECFRRADAIDVSCGLLRYGVPRARLRELVERYPRAGFHGLLAGRILRYALRRPWNPLPMLRW